MSAYRARQLRDEPQSVRYPTREYQQRQPSLERGVADQTDLNNDEHGQSRLREQLTKALRRDACAHLTEDSHISDLGQYPEYLTRVRTSLSATRTNVASWMG